MRTSATQWAKNAEILTIGLWEYTNVKYLGLYYFSVAKVNVIISHISTHFKYIVNDKEHSQ